MPKRRTLRGAERTPLTGDADVLICGASFAGLAVARELAGSGARVLVLDRYEIGERQTSACGIPTEWLRAMDLMGSQRQEFGRLVVHTPHGTARLARGGRPRGAAGGGERPPPPGGPAPARPRGPPPRRGRREGDRDRPPLR